MAIINSPIGDNIIKTGSGLPYEGRETVLLGAQRVDVGVNSGRTEIATDKQSGFKYERDAIEGKTIYNLQTQQHKAFFVLDLETGGRGWYPGAIQIGDITGTDIPIKSDKSETSQTLITVSNVTVKINDLEYDSEQRIWYNVTYNDITGYVKNIYISNVRYTDPY